LYRSWLERHAAINACRKPGWKENYLRLFHRWQGRPGNLALSLLEKGQSEVIPVPTRITSMEQLKSESEQGAEFFILLNHNLRSSKDIVWDAEAKRFHIFNHIDQTVQHLTEHQIMDESLTNIGFAMRRGALFKEDF
jgi:hypothetical protein